MRSLCIWGQNICIIPMSNKQAKLDEVRLWRVVRGSGAAGEGSRKSRFHLTEQNLNWLKLDYCFFMANLCSTSFGSVEIKYVLNENIESEQFFLTSCLITLRPTCTRDFRFCQSDWFSKTFFSFKTLDWILSIEHTFNSFVYCLHFNNLI